MRSSSALGFLPAESCRPVRPTLRDPGLQGQLDERGYAVMPFLGAEQVLELSNGYDAIIEDLGGANAPGDYNDTYAEFSIIHSRPEFRRRAFDLISSVLVPTADRYLIDHHPLFANFVNKPPGTGVVPTHQNFSVVDESRHRSVSVWVALVDCVVGNGAMSVLEGSHRSMRGQRGMWAYQAFSGIEHAAIEELLVPLEVQAGHAVVLDDALVHYSPPNHTETRRLAIQFVMVPDEAPSLWFQQVGASGDRLDISVWEVDERYFFEFWHGDGDRRYAVPAGSLTLPAAALDRGALATLLETNLVVR